ncbi:MAG: MFS transporter [Clostridia bacterium]|nr:MFS transporter [Clostridia bacterium]
MRNISLKKEPILTKAGKTLYGVGDLGFSLVTNTIASFFMFFGTVVCGVPGTLMGLAYSLATVWDAVTDPIVGYLSDRKRSRLFGRRHWFIFISIFGMALVNVFLWNVPINAEPVVKFFWFVLSLIMFNLCTTFFNTPNSALSVEISGDYNERTVIQSVRSVFLLIGTILPTVLMSVLQSPTELYPDGRYNPASHTNMAYIASSILFICGTISFIGSFSQVPRLKAKLANELPPPKKSLKVIFTDFFKVLKKPIYRNIILAYSISLVATAFLTAAGFHLFTYSFKLETMSMYALIALLFLMTIFSQPLWMFIVSKFDKRTAVLSGLGTMIVGILYIFALFVMRENIKLSTMTLSLIPGLCLAGGGMGALYSMPTGMLGDAIAVEKMHTKEDNTATYTGFMTFGNKLSQSVALLIIGVMLDLIGFKEGSTYQSPEVEWGLGWIVFGGILAALIGGFIFYSKYDLKKSDVPDLDGVSVEEDKTVIVGSEDDFA